MSRQTRFTIDPDELIKGNVSTSSLVNRVSIVCTQADGLRPGQLVNDYGEHGGKVAIGIVERQVNVSNDASEELVYPKGKRVSVVNFGCICVEAGDTIHAYEKLLYDVGTGTWMIGGLAGVVLVDPGFPVYSTVDAVAGDLIEVFVGFPLGS